jgi:solute carrier family 25 carnitine/acylcarnitine transporter 20/29
VSNIVGTAFGHPLDTIRVRMQLEGKHVTLSSVCRETYMNEGARGFFKGMVSPLVGVTPYNVR